MSDSKEHDNRHDRGQPNTRRQAAKKIGVTEGTLAVWASTGRYNLPFAKIGDRAIYFERDLEAFIERNMVRQPDAGM